METKYWPDTAGRRRCCWKPSSGSLQHTGTNPQNLPGKKELSVCVNSKIIEKPGREIRDFLWLLKCSWKWKKRRSVGRGDLTCGHDNSRSKTASVTHISPSSTSRPGNAWKKKKSKKSIFLMIQLGFHMMVLSFDYNMKCLRLTLFLLLKQRTCLCGGGPCLPGAGQADADTAVSEDFSKLLKLVKNYIQKFWDLINWSSVYVKMPEEELMAFSDSLVEQESHTDGPDTGCGLCWQHYISLWIQKKKEKKWDSFVAVKVK